MWSATRYMRDLALAFLALAIIPSTAPAQTTSYSQRLAGLQQRNAFQQQQAAVQAAVQQTTALTQSAFRQGTYRPNGLPLPVVQPLPLNFLLQQAALENALQQTRALQQASLQRNPTLSRLALRPLNTLEAVQQQSLALQNALQIQNNLLTPGQLLQLSQEQPTVSQLLINQPIPVRTPGAGGR